MKKPTTDRTTKFLLFALPCYWTSAVLFIVLVIWKVGLSEPDLIPVVLVSVEIIIAAILLVKNHYWISLPMILLGAYIAQQDDQFVGHILRFFGVYLILHYVLCSVWRVYIQEQKKEKQTAGLMEEQ